MTLSKSDVASHENRPFIKDLLAKHSAAIAFIRDSIQNDKDCKELSNKGENQKRYDDIWILRYVLSHKGNAKSASKAALKTIKFREEKKLNELGDIRHRLRNWSVVNETSGSSEPLPGFSVFNKYCGDQAAFVTLPDKDRGIIIYCDVGQIDMNGIAEGMSEEDMKDNLLYSNEAIFQVVDDVTRRTGRLTKQMKIIDMGNVSLLKMNRVYLKRDGACSKAIEDYYPQLLGTLFVFNSPSWLSVVWSALRPLFPKRFVQKIDFLPPMSKIQKSKQSHLKPILRYLSEEHLPERYGGQNKEWPLPSAGLQFGPQSN